MPEDVIKKEPESKEGGKNNTGGAAVGIAVILIAVGALIFLGNYIPGFNMSNLWPLFIMIPVVIMVPALVYKGKEAYGTLFPITFLTFLTVYFLLHNFIGYELVKYTWPCFILMPALGLLSLYAVNRQNGLLIPIGILTAAAVVCWGLIINNTLMTAILFIVAGAAIIIKILFFKKKNK